MIIGLYGKEKLVKRHYDMLLKVKDKPNLKIIKSIYEINNSIDIVVSDVKLDVNQKIYLIKDTIQTALAYYYLTLNNKDWQDVTSLEFLNLAISDIKTKSEELLHKKLKTKYFSYEIAFDLKTGYSSTILPLVKEFDDKSNAAIFQNYEVLNDKNFKLKQINKIVLDKNLDFNHRGSELLKVSKIFISPEFSKTQEEVINISFPHGILMKPINPLTNINIMKYSDYIYVTTKYEMAKYIYILQKFNHLLNKRLCLIPGGYPKLDKLRKDLKEDKTKKDSILYAPTILEHNPEFQNSLSLLNGKEIIKYLLDNFLNYNIIFRPHPSVRRFKHTGYDITMEIINLFKDNPRFIYDDSVYYIDTFKRSEIMISDYSSSMITFSLSTQRPFISLNNYDLSNEYKKVYGDLSLDIRKEIGFIVYEIDAIKQKIEQYLKDKEYYKNKIIEFSKNNIFNLDNSVEYFKNNLNYIKNGIHNENWIYIEK